MTDTAEILASNPELSAEDVAALASESVPQPSVTVPNIRGDAESKTEPAPKKARGGKRRRNTEDEAGSTMAGEPPPPPLAGGPPEGASAGTGGGAGSRGNVSALLQAADPSMLADILVTALDGAALALAKKRYGAKRAREVQASKEAKAEIKAAAIAYLKAASVQMTPGTAVIVAVVGAYLGPVMALEMGAQAETEE